MDSAFMVHAYRSLAGHIEVADEIDRKVAALKASLFDKQIAYVEDPAKEKAALCTRRAGKTTLVPRHHLIVGLQRPETISRYWAITRLRAKRLIWDELQKVNHEFSLGAEFNHTELEAHLPNGSKIRLHGADKEKEVHKERGEKTVLETIDECQTFGAHLQPLVDDVIGPSLLDLMGDLSLMGTPGVICHGQWYAITAEQCPPAQRVLGYSIHRWGAKDNVAMPHIWGEALKLKEKRGWGDDHPTWMREYLGLWVNDAGALFYRFNPLKNLHRKTFDQLTGPGWMHSIGWDIGFDDSMALTVWAWHPKERVLYEALSWKKSGIIVDEVMEYLGTFIDKLNPVKAVSDTGGLGKLITEEARRRFGRHFEPAKKSEKYEHSRLFNDDLTASRVKLMEGSLLHAEMSILPTDVDSPPGKPPREDPRYANHCCDAALYSWRACAHWLFEVEEEKPKPGTPEWAAKQEDVMLTQQEEEFESSQSGEWWEQ